MLIISIIALTSLFLVGATFFIECKIVNDLPEDNGFKRWWRNNIVGPDPEG